MFTVLAAWFSLTINATVPVICGIQIDGNTVNHLCNAPVSYEVTVSSPVKFRYGEYVLPAGTHTLTFIGPEKVSRTIEPLE